MNHSAHGKCLRGTLAVAAALGFGVCAPASAQLATVSDAWQFEVTPYIWLAGIDGDVKNGRLATNGAEASFSDILSDLEFGLMGTFEARKGRWGVLVDGIYLDLSSTATTPDRRFGDVNVDLTTQLYSAAATYRVADGPVKFDVLGGARYLYVKSDLDVASGTPPALFRGRRVVDSDRWWDGYVGARVLYPFAERWSVVGYGDLGGGGSNLTWQLLGGVNYELSKTFSAKLGYRYLQIDREDADFVYDVALGGFYLGAGIRF